MRKLLFVGVLWLIAGCGSNDPTPRYGAPSVPLELLGTWHYQLFGDQLCDPSTGSCVPSYARSETLQLTSDGRFTYVLYGETNFPPCGRVITAEGRGTARVSGPTLSLSVERGSTRNDDSCGDSFANDERGNTWTYAWELLEGELMLTNDQGTRIGPFQRQPGQ